MGRAFDVYKLPMNPHKNRGNLHDSLGMFKRGESPFCYSIKILKAISLAMMMMMGEFG